MTRPWLGLDIGGANLKAADGNGRAVSVPFPVWQRPHELATQITAIRARFPHAERLAVTMTAELCDCFATRTEGVLAVLEAIAAAAPGVPTRVWGTDGFFHDPITLRKDDDPLCAAASNWLATATLAARHVPSGSGLFIDIGSTTTDLIRLHDGRPVPTGRTDLDRFRSGELVYAGGRRTPLFALSQTLPWRDGVIGVAAERFATTHDVYLALGDIPPDPDDTDTADGRPATLPCALSRIARMVGGDRDTLSDDEILALARAFDRALFLRLVREAHRVWDTTDEPVSTPTIVLAGSGAFLAARLAREWQPDASRIVDLGLLWGAEASHAAAAHAVAVLAAEEEDATKHLSPTPSPLEGEGWGGGDSPIVANALQNREESRPESRPTVILKLGGSLLSWPELPAALAELAREYAHQKAILIVGGGSIVDCLRVLDQTHAMGDRSAHELAIRALDLTAHVAASLAPAYLAVSDINTLIHAWNIGRLPVLPPGPLLDDDPNAPAPSWDVTSDTIAAHLAVRLGARTLVVLKSASVPPGATRRDAARLGLVDPAFPAAAAAIPDVRYRNLRATAEPAIPLLLS